MFLLDALAALRATPRVDEALTRGRQAFDVHPHLPTLRHRVLLASSTSARPLVVVTYDPFVAHALTEPVLAHFRADRGHRSLTVMAGPVPRLSGSAKRRREHCASTSQSSSSGLSRGSTSTKRRVYGVG